MADKIFNYVYRYKFELYYLDMARNKTIQIDMLNIGYILIDHNYESNSMPILFLNLTIDKALVNDIILNSNTNLFTLVMYKYNDDNDNNNLEVEVFRKKFIYFVPENATVNDDIDYNENNEEEHMGNLLRDLNLGLMCLDHITNNKYYRELNAKNITMYDAVKYCMSHMDNLLIEPFNYNDLFDQLIMPGESSIRKSLEYLNNYRVFYNTPYRYYQDFNYTYLISSSGKPIMKNDDMYGSVIITIKDILDDEANKPGFIINKTRGNYNVIVNYADTSIYDNTIINKSKNKIKGITSSGSDTKTLSNTSPYYSNNINAVRINNDNIHMLENIEADYNSSNVYISIIKEDLDTDIFTINKQYSFRNIDKYSKLDGYYLLTRKQEMYKIISNKMVVSLILNFRKID